MRGVPVGVQGAGAALPEGTVRLAEVLRLAKAELVTSGLSHEASGGCMDRSAPCCLLVAVVRVEPATGDERFSLRLRELVAEAAGVKYSIFDPTAVFRWSDAATTDEALAAFDRAIEKAEAEETSS